MTTGIPKIIAYSKITPLEGKTICVDEKDNLEVFDIKRIYWINYNTPEKTASEHAHKYLQQIVIAISGSIDISLENTHGEIFSYTLNDPAQGLCIPAMYWKKIKYFEPCVLLCLASEIYNENDYIRDYDTFKAFETK